VLPEFSFLGWYTSLPSSMPLLQQMTAALCANTRLKPPKLDRVVRAHLDPRSGPSAVQYFWSDGEGAPGISEAIVDVSIETDNKAEQIALETITLNEQIGGEADKLSAAEAADSSKEQMKHSFVGREAVPGSIRPKNT
jgi:hypothetical protein